MSAVSCAFTPLSCLSDVFFSFVSCLQLICSRKNKTQEVKQKISEFLEGEDTHVSVLVAVSASSWMLTSPVGSSIQRFSPEHTTPDLSDRCYIPLLRATDNSSQPVIGALWSPESSERLSLLHQPGRSPIDPVMAVSAFAGPLSPSKVGSVDEHLPAFR